MSISIFLFLGSAVLYAAPQFSSRFSVLLPLRRKLPKGRQDIPLPLTRGVPRTNTLPGHKHFRAVWSLSWWFTGITSMYTDLTVSNIGHVYNIIITWSSTTRWEDAHWLHFNLCNPSECCFTSRSLHIPSLLLNSQCHRFQSHKKKTLSCASQIKSDSQASRQTAPGHPFCMFVFKSSSDEIYPGPLLRETKPAPKPYLQVCPLFTHNVWLIWPDWERGGRQRGEKERGGIAVMRRGS